MRIITALVVVLTASVPSAQTRSVFLEELTWPGLATAEMGRAFLDMKVTDAVEQIRKVSAAK